MTSKNPAAIATAAAAALLAWLLAPPAGPGAGARLGAAAAQDVLRIAAVVNDEVISERDLAERLRLVAVTSGLQPTIENQRRLLPQVLRGLIQERLQLQEARRLNISVTDEEIAQALATIAQQNNMSPEQLRGVLAASGVGEDVLRRQLEAQIAWLKVVGREVRPRVTVTEAQVEQAMRERARAPGQPEYLLAEILLPVDDPEQATAAARDAERLVEALRGGADFEALARQFSAAGSAARGGTVGWVPASAVPPELGAVIDSLAPGEVSPPVRSNLGYHLFMLRDRRVAAPPEAGDAAAATAADRERVVERLEQEQLQRLARRYLRDLRKDAFVDIRIGDDGAGGDGPVADSSGGL